MGKQPERHQLVLEKTYPSGAEEWYCPTCGRRFIMFWPPDYKKIVLEYGNEYAIHSAGKGMDLLSGRMDMEVKKTDQEDQSLIPWQEWMDKINFENLWNEQS